MKKITQKCGCPDLIRKKRSIKVIIKRKPLKENKNMEISCKVIITNPKNNKIMLVRITESDNKYDLPGGHMEEGETPEQTAIREVKEETGIIVSNLTDIGKDGKWHFFKTKKYDNSDIKLQKEEVSEIKWVSEGQLKKHNLTNGAKRGIAKINKGEKNERNQFSFK